MDRQDALLRIVGEIYASVGHPAKWSECLRSIETLLEGTAVNVVYHDHRSHRGGISESTIDPAAHDAYSTYFHSLDPWALSISPGSIVPEQVMWGQALVSHERMMKTEFYSDFGRRFDITRALIGVIESSGQLTGAVSINRSDKSPEFDVEAGRLLATLLPHLRRALSLHRKLLTVDTERTALADILDRFRAAVVLIDHDQRVVMMNRAASKLASARDGIGIDKSRVVGMTANATAALASAIVAALANAGAETIEVGSAHVALPRSNGRPALDALVLPLAQTEVPSGMAALFITDSQEGPILSKRVLIERYGFTPAEARVASALAQGQSVKDIAERLHLTEQTTRWYVKQVLAKTGTSTQSQIVRLLLSITPALVRTEES